MKKQKVSLKKLNLTKSKVASLETNNVSGGYLYFLTDNGCGPQYSVWPDICPISHNCPPPQTDGCPGPDPQTANCQSIVGCYSIGCVSIVC